MARERTMKPSPPYRWITRAGPPTRPGSGTTQYACCPVSVSGVGRKIVLRNWDVYAVRLVLVLLLASLFAPAVLSRELRSYALVEEDGTLRISGRQVHLYGIHIPPTGRTCRTFIRPVRCGSRASLALDFRIQGFVSCEVIRQHRDRSVTGLCRVGGEDLSAYLLSRGWALALPDAPFEYVALERIARHKNLGVWGMPVDRIGKRR